MSTNKKSTEINARSATAANNSANPANTSKTLTAQQEKAKIQCELDGYGKYSDGTCGCPGETYLQFKLNGWRVDKEGRCRPKEQRDCKGEWSYSGNKCIVPSAANTASSAANTAAPKPTQSTPTTSSSASATANHVKVYGLGFQHKCNNITTTVQTAKTAAELQCVALDSATDIADKTDYMPVNTVCDPDKKLCAYKVKDMIKGKSGVMCCKIDSGAGSVTCDIRNEKKHGSMGIIKVSEDISITDCD